MNYIFLRENEIIKKVDIDKHCYIDNYKSGLSRISKSIVYTVSIWTSSTEIKPYIIFLNGNDIYNNKNIFNNLSEEDKKYFLKYKPKWWKF